MSSLRSRWRNFMTGRPLREVQLTLGVTLGILLFPGTLYAQTTVTIPSTQPWTDTGLTVSQGDVITVSASGTVIFADPHTPENTTGPDGKTGPSGGCTFVVTSAAVPRQALIGNIANSSSLDGNGFFVGSNFNGTVPIANTTTQSGKLFLGFNDGAVFCDRSGYDGWGFAGDNHGSFTATITINTQPPTFTLTVTKTGTGSGTVTSNPAGINCGTDCTESYSSGTTVTLTAPPASGSTFAGWSGDLDCSDGSVTMTASKSCTATFNGSTGSVPVVLVHGWCGAADETTFGNMKTLLENDTDLNLKRKVFYFNYSGNNSDVQDPDCRGNLRCLAQRLGKFIKEKKGSSSQVDVVAHSMGGLIARAWMAGLTAEKYDKEIRRLILVATPNFGVQRDMLSRLRPPTCPETVIKVEEVQKAYMFYGNQFLQSLNLKWEHEIDNGNIHPQDIMTIVGCSAQPFPAETCTSDRGLVAGIGVDVVDAASASLPSRSADYRVTYVRRAHFGDIVNITDDRHEIYQLVKAFLKGETPATPYQPLLVSGLFVTPLIDATTRNPLTETNGVRFVVYREGTAMWPCGGYKDSVRIIAEEPYDSDGSRGLSGTGWWTIRPSDLIGLLRGQVCLVVELDKKGKYESTNSVKAAIVGGRPAITEL